MDDLSRLRAVLTDRFEIQRELGHGGMAIVYLARDRKLGRLVALKVLLPEVAAAIGPDRFLREIQIAARLSHPHILQLYDSAEIEGRLFYVMPYVEGESLRQRLDREGPLPVADAVRFATEVAAALDYAHQQGIVHRDIKPRTFSSTPARRSSPISGSPEPSTPRQPRRVPIRRSPPPGWSSAPRGT